MLEVIHNSGNRIDIALNGKIDADGMTAALDALIKESENIEDGVMLYRIEDFQFPSIAAIAVEFARMPKMLKLMKRFKRCAVLSDKKWLRQLSEIEGKLFPNIEIKAFEFNDFERAELWLNSED
ncbi:STAS/SEC14 domain-containing protein [Zhongshania borealis]|uniref:STAS/SEC14 domain-containing protein n=1 Tax=Zhongshania borealis TaxID=889488 RepID=A0ABP7WNX2_9GAMM